MQRRWTILPLAAAVVVALTGCESQQPTVIRVTVTPGASSAATASSTPTPVSRLSIDDAKSLYLETGCVSNSSADAVGRAANGGQYSDLKAAAATALKNDTKLVDTWSATPWPTEVAADVATSVSAIRQTLTWEQGLIDAGSLDAANAVDGPTLQGKGPEIRAALGLPADYVQACVGHMPSTFQDGYPKKVKASMLPSVMEGTYPASADVLQVAPGLWTKIDPGATWADTIQAANYDGYCGSKKAFERKYYFGQQTSGSCW